MVAILLTRLVCAKKRQSFIFVFKKDELNRETEV